jgi:hypothetical protein
MKTEIIWKTWPQKPTSSDLPILVYTSGKDVYSYGTYIPCFLTEWPLNPPALWATVQVPEIVAEEEEDPLQKYVYISAVRDAVIACSNAESADQARRIFNQTFINWFKS